MKQNVLMFDAAYPPPVVGGKEKQAHLLAKALKAQGVNVEAASYSHNNNVSGVHQGVFVQRISSGLRSLPAVIYSLIKSRLRFKILHIHTPSRIGKFVAFFGWMLGYRIVFKFPNEHLLDNTSFVHDFVWQILFRIVSLFVMLEEDTKNKLQRHGVKQDKIFHAVNGVEMGKLMIPSQAQKPIKLIFVGRLMPQKSCDQLIHACSLLRQHGLDFSLTIIGGGPLKNDLKKLIRNLNLLEQITFKGYQSDTLSYMQRADILILPSQREGMSNVILEAISIGLPVVATDVGSAKMQVGPFGKHFLCKPSDPECLAEKIMRLATNFKLRKEYGKYLYKRGHELFSIDAVARQYIQEYKKLL